MLMFTQGTGWDAMRADVGHTLATMRAAGEHEGLQAPLAGLLARWTVIEGERAAAADRVTEGNAAVTWGATALGRAVGRFAVQLLAACDNDRSSLTFQAYVPERPSEVQGLALEAMVARVGRLDRAEHDRVRVRRGAARAPDRSVLGRARGDSRRRAQLRARLCAARDARRARELHRGRLGRDDPSRAERNGPSLARRARRSCRSRRCCRA
jgi:hypothetical protein